MRRTDADPRAEGRPSPVERLLDAKTIAPLASVFFLIALTVLIVRRSTAPDVERIPAATPAMPPPERKPEGYYYRVQRGDTLETIAKRVYHDSRAWRPIAIANEIDDPRKLRAGKLIWIPAITIRHGRRPAPRDPAAQRGPGSPAASTAPRSRTRE